MRLVVRPQEKANNKRLKVVIKQQYTKIKNFGS